MTHWLDAFLEFGFLGIPLIAIAIGLLFVSDDTAHENSRWKFGRNDPFKTLFYRENGKVREGFRLSLVAVATTAVLYLAISTILRLFG